jgi:hypothetical protein
MTDETQLPTVAEKSTLDLGEMFQGMIDLATNPDVDPAKMEAMLTMQERMIDRQALTAYRRAMHKARAKMPRIEKDGKITGKGGTVMSRYANYENIDKIVRPLVEEEGLTYGFDFKQGEQGRVLVTCIVSHVDGHEERFGPMPLSVDTTGAKNATQGAGSAGKYGQRYTLTAAFNIVTVGADDDGNMGQQNTNAQHGFDSLVEDGQKAASQGTAAYQKWFSDLPSAMAKGWLVDQGHHANLKSAAAQHDD